MSSNKPQPEALPEKKVKIPTVGGNGVRPGVDLTNNAALWELIDESERDFKRRKHFAVRTPKRRR